MPSAMSTSRWSRPTVPNGKTAMDRAVALGVGVNVTEGGLLCAAELRSLTNVAASTTTMSAPTTGQIQVRRCDVAPEKPDVKEPLTVSGLSSDRTISFALRGLEPGDF